MYRIIVTKNKPKKGVNNFLYTELRTDSSRKEIVHQSLEEAEQTFYGMFAPDNFVSAGTINGVSIMMPKKMTPVQNVEIYPLWFNLVQVLSTVNDDATKPNKRVNDIFLIQLKKLHRHQHYRKNQ